MSRWVSAVMAVLAVAGFVSFPASANAAPPSLEFSVDGGVSWMSSPPTTIFNPAFRFVPGDSISSTILFRSTRGEPTAVVVTLGDRAVSEALLGEALSLSAADDTGAGLMNARLSSIQDCQPLIPVRVVAGNEPIAITLSIDVSTTLTNRQAQSSISTSTIDIGLTDPGNVVALSGCVPDAAAIPIVATSPITPTGTDSTVPGRDVSAGSAQESSADLGPGLAWTGSDSWRPALIASATAVVAGATMLLVARRRSRGRSRERAQR